MIDGLKAKNAALVCALDRIHDVLNGVYVDDISVIVNNALAINAKPDMQTEAISIGIAQYDDIGNWCVEMIVTGLSSEQQALAAMEYIKKLFCGDEIQVG